MSTEEFEKAVESLCESSLSRIFDHIMSHDCAIITAFRKDPFDREKCVCKDLDHSDESSALRANKMNNRDLKASLLAMGFGVTKVDGSFIENYNTTRAVEVKEDSLFVVNLEDRHGFFDVIAELGEKYCQDSVLIIPKGGREVFLLGTNFSDFPGYGEKVVVGRWKGGKEAEFMTKVRGRPFVFETYKDLSRMERMAAKSIAKRILGTRIDS